MNEIQSLLVVIEKETKKRERGRVVVVVVCSVPERNEADTKVGHALDKPCRALPGEFDWTL